jgi:hypothetical protein
MSEDEVRDAIEALYYITAELAYICERNGMSAAEGSELTKQFRRLNASLGMEWHAGEDA